MSNRNYLTPDKVKVYEILFRMVAQFILIVTAVVAFFIVLNHLLNATDTASKTVLGIVDSILAATIFRLYYFYFPLPKKKK